jgi:hypothetical protein
MCLWGIATIGQGFVENLRGLIACRLLAGGFSGLLAYGISKMAGTRGYNGWSWIFIL